MRVLFHKAVIMRGRYIHVRRAGRGRHYEKQEGAPGHSTIHNTLLDVGKLKNEELTEESADHICRTFLEKLLYSRYYTGSVSVSVSVIGYSHYHSDCYY